jgi:hypothetical protein
MPTADVRLARIMTFLALVLGGRRASAHFVLLYPPSRGVTLESAPCGAAGSSRGAAPTVLRPGQTIVVRWNVQVDHVEPPRFRIAFDDAGQDFPTPVGAHDTSTLPLFLDGVLTAGGGVQTKEIALPNLECDNCTLQMLQYLNPAPPYAPGNFYYQCADITLSAAAPGDAASDRADAGSAASAGDAGPSDDPPRSDARAAPEAGDGGAGRRPPASAPPAVTGASGCEHVGDVRGGPTAPGLLATLLAWTAWRSRT